MAQFLLIRHGTPDYSYIDTKKFRGFGNDLAPLTNNGVLEIIEASQRDIIQDADLIISSPHTRTMHTASILSKELALDLIVEVDLMEWIPDKDFMYDDYEQVVKWRKHYEENNGKNTYEEDNFEEKEEIIARVNNVLKKYDSYNKVIVVTHGMIINALTDVKKPKCAQIVEYRLNK